MGNLLNKSAGLELLFKRGKTRAMPARTKNPINYKGGQRRLQHPRNSMETHPDHTDGAALNGHLMSYFTSETLTGRYSFIWH